jgi:hypothetical protein
MHPGGVYYLEGAQVIYYPSGIVEYWTRVNSKPTF